MNKVLLNKKCEIFVTDILIDPSFVMAGIG